MSSKLAAWFDAALNGDVIGADLLIAEGIDVNAQDKLGRTAIHIAALYRHLPLLRVLLANSDADPTLFDDDGCAGIHLAASRSSAGHDSRFDDPEALRLFLDHPRVSPSMVRLPSFTSASMYIVCTLTTIAIFMFGPFHCVCC